MDVNCVLNCTHQKEGKCSLVEIPMSVSMNFHINNEHDCAYYDKV